MQKIGWSRGREGEKVGGVKGIQKKGGGEREKRKEWSGD